MINCILLLSSLNSSNEKLSLTASLSLLLLSRSLSISFLNKSLIEASYQRDERTCNREDQAEVSFFTRGDKDQTRVGFFVES